MEQSPTYGASLAALDFALEDFGRTVSAFTQSTSTGNTLTYPKINLIVSFYDPFQLQVWSDPASSITRAVLLPHADSDVIREFLAKGGVASGLHFNPLFNSVHALTWFPIGFGTSMSEALEALEVRLSQLPEEDMPLDGSTVWTHAVTRVCGDVQDVSHGSNAATIASTFSAYPQSRSGFANTPGFP